MAPLKTTLQASQAFPYAVLFAFELALRLWKNLLFWGSDFSRWKQRCQFLAYFDSCALALSVSQVEAPKTKIFSSFTASLASPSSKCLA